ncbi:MAG TPA: hypothetical protein VHC21_00015 [Candidatus Saccharimonadales bacterium]|nr:hypothetical protein [Candidatus Saccharimonadales bacterium]
MSETILITASSFDEQTYGPVCKILEDRGYETVVYKTDRVLSGEDNFTLHQPGDGSISMHYNGVSILPEQISAAWYRKLGAFTVRDADEQLSKQLHMNNEIRALHDNVWSFYPDELWLNAPQKLQKADRKLNQLIVANEIGFKVPETVLSSDWEEISDRLLDSNDGQMIMKMMRGVISENNQIKVFYAAIADRQKVSELMEGTVPFPGIYQSYAEKFREWRVTVVGDNVFPAAIYTERHAKDDWRKHQLTSAVEFKEGELPDRIGSNCVAYLGKMGLRYGAFDLVENSDGEITFLECNPNGEYGWLEQALGFPISEAIANELIAIAAS